MKANEMRTRSAWVILLLAAVMLWPASAFAGLGTLTGDTFVQSDKVNQNFGTAPTLNIRQSGPTQVSFIQFDLNLPAGTTSGQISQALLKVFVAKVTTGGTLTLRQVTGSWSEDTLTWGNQPGAVNLGSAPITAADNDNYGSLTSPRS